MSDVYAEIMKLLKDMDALAIYEDEKRVQRLVRTVRQIAETEQVLKSASRVEPVIKSG